MASLREDLAPHETNLMGQWLDTGSRIVGDATEERIDWLTRERLQLRATSSDGWDRLFRDPADGRLWELTYPFSEMQGGGPRQLRLLAPAEVHAKYPEASA